MVNCCVPFCDTDTRKLKEFAVRPAFHEFPVDFELRKKWIQHIRRENFAPNDHSRVCSLHFTTNDYVEDLKIKRLKKGSFPTVFQEYPKHVEAVKRIKVQPPPKIRHPPSNEKPQNRKRTSTVQEVNKNQVTGSDISADSSLQNSDVCVKVPISNDSEKIAHTSFVEMVNCCVPCCHTSHRNKQVKNVSFHEFPCDLQLRTKWLANIRRKNFTVGNASYVCSQHFVTSDYIDGHKCRRLKDGVIPSVFPHYPTHLQTASLKSGNKDRPPPKLHLPLPKKIPKSSKNECETQDALISKTEKHLVSADVSESVFVKTTPVANEELEFDEEEGQDTLDLLVPATQSPQAASIPDLVSEETACDVNDVTMSCEEGAIQEQGKFQTQCDDVDTNKDHHDIIVSCVGGGAQEQRNSEKASCSKNEKCFQTTNYIKVIGLQKKASYLKKQVNFWKAKSTELEDQLKVFEASSNDILKVIETDAENGSLRAIFLLDQIKAYSTTKARFSTETLLHCLLWKMKSPGGYEFVRKSNTLSLPSASTLRRHTGITVSTCNSPRRDEISDLLSESYDEHLSITESINKDPSV